MNCVVLGMELKLLRVIVVLELAVSTTDFHLAVKLLSETNPEITFTVLV